MSSARRVSNRRWSWPRRAAPAVSPLVDRLDRLPAPQRDALSVAFGLSAGSAPDRLLIGLSVLSLLSEFADDQPLVCIIDDLQWLDRATVQVLAFLSRRLIVDPVALVMATRIPTVTWTGCRPWRWGAGRSRCPGATGQGVDRPARRAGPRPDHRRNRGQPARVDGISSGLTDGDLAGGFGMPSALAFSGRIEESFHAAWLVARGDQTTPADGSGRTHR